MSFSQTVSHGPFGSSSVTHSGLGYGALGHPLYGAGYLGAYGAGLGLGLGSYAAAADLAATRASVLGATGLGLGYPHHPYGGLYGSSLYHPYGLGLGLGAAVDSTTTSVGPFGGVTTVRRRSF